MRYLLNTLELNKNGREVADLYIRSNRVCVGGAFTDNGDVLSLNFEKIEEIDDVINMLNSIKTSFKTVKTDSAF